MEFKEFLEQEFKNKGSSSYYSNKIEFDLTSNCYRPIDFDLSLDIEKYKQIEKYTIVFILEQYSGWI